MRNWNFFSTQETLLPWFVGGGSGSIGKGFKISGGDEYPWHSYVSNSARKTTNTQPNPLQEHHVNQNI